MTIPERLLPFQKWFLFTELFAFILESAIPLNVVVCEPAHMVFCSTYLRGLVDVSYGHKET